MVEENKIQPIPQKAKEKMVETYAEDMATVIGSNREGLIKQIINQEEERDQEKNNTSPEIKKNNFFTIAGMFLIITTLVLLFVSNLKKEAETVPLEKQFTPIIFNDKNVFLEIAGLKKDQIIKTFYNAISKSDLKNREVEGIYLTENKQIVGLKRFLTLLESNFVLPETSTSLVSENFLTGVVQNDSEKGVFILIKMRSVADIFDKIRNWENKMFLDMHDFFNIDLSSTTKYLLTKNFEDSIIENKNARVLYEGETVDSSNIAMMYVFSNENSIVISNSTSAAHEIMSRLSSGRIKK